MSRAPTDAVVSLAAVNPINAAVLKMVLDSPVGRSMSDGDRVALTQTLTTTDVREVQGWLGEQIRKAARDVVKGDYDGHPFRGNQYADASGAGTGGAGGAKYLGLGGESKAESLGLGRGQKDRALSEAGGGRRVVSGSRAKLASDADDLAQSIEELLGMAEVENDLGRTDQAKQTMAEVKSRQKELKAIRAELESRAKRESGKIFAESQRKAELKPVTSETLNQRLKGDELTTYREETKEAVTAAKTVAVELLSELGDRAKSTANKLSGLKGEARKEASAALKEAQSAIREAVGYRKEFEELAAQAYKRPTAANALRMQSRGMDLGEMFKGETRAAEEAMDRVETIIKNPTIRAARSITAIRTARGKAAETKSTNDTASLQSAADKNFGVSPDKYDLDDALHLLDE